MQNGNHDNDPPGSDNNNGDGDTDAPGPVASDWDEVSQDLCTDTQCLVDLGPLIESPILDSSKNTPFFRDIISRRFPRAKEGLVNRLARAT